jgi:hypothetical protein
MIAQILISIFIGAVTILSVVITFAVLIYCAELLSNAISPQVKLWMLCAIFFGLPFILVSYAIGSSLLK